MKLFKHLLILPVVICCGLLVKANNGGNIGKKSLEPCLQGFVTDAVTHKPVNGVTVSLSSNMPHYERELHSDAGGHFTFAKLPPGNITLLFAKKGYKLFRSHLLDIKQGSTVKITVDFQPDDEGGGGAMWRPLLKLLD
jgi:hypothetical protein